MNTSTRFLQRTLPHAVQRLAALLLLCSATAFGQGAVVSGVVVDANTSLPVIGAIVTLGAPPDVRTTRTDELGGFNFANVAKETYPLSVRGVGYIAFNQSVAITGEERLNVSLTRVSSLDTVRVKDGVQAIFGVVASPGFVPLPNAAVQIYGASVGQTTTDSSGRFFYQVKAPGAYLVRAKASGLNTASVSINVPSKKRVEVMLMLDTTAMTGGNALEMAYGDMRERLMRRGQQSVLVPRGELVERGNGNRPLTNSLMNSRTFESKGLKFTDTVCMFVDGNPQPGRSVNSILSQDVESVEAYGPDGDRSQTLAKRFPVSGNCGDTGLPRLTQAAGAPARPDVIRWLVVWLKH